jgi:hypothetical protein
LYLYTEKPVGYYCSEFLRGMLKPLLEYVAQELGPPIPLNGCVFPSTSHNIYDPNFEYLSPTKGDLASANFESFFVAVKTSSKQRKPGMTCTLKVSLPARLDHDFWKSDSLDGNSFDGESIVLEVNRWGYDWEAAKQSAACHAENIIRDVRLHLKQGRLPAYELVRNEEIVALASSRNSAPNSSDIFKCRVLELGNGLCRVWKFGNSNFTTLDIAPFCMDGIDNVLKSKLPLALIRYYEVTNTLVHEGN